MRTADFDYDLPPELIAQEPLPGREQSRMMVLDRGCGTIEHLHIGDLPNALAVGDLMVVNDTRVIPARVFGCWCDTGGRVELLLVEDCGEGDWLALCRSSRRVRAGLTLALADARLTGTVKEALGGGRIRVTLAGPEPVLDVLNAAGIPPVPPYIRRPVDRPELVDVDRERYQTVYARHPGAIAAPTAGLHFSEELLERLDRRHVRRTAITLHVGPGTFKPVSVEDVDQHVMEAEAYAVSAETAEIFQRTRQEGGRVLAVGSTSVRTLETVMGAHGLMSPCHGRSDLFIRPPYRFCAVDLMLTNFHLPRSSLLMMVSAFVEQADPGTGSGVVRLMEAYSQAMERGYRFYSYGDCMLIR